MIPGEYDIQPGDIELNAGRRTLALSVANTGDRPIQVGSHYHFFEVNDALAFDRPATRGMRLNIAAGTAVRFEPGQSREVELVEIGGDAGIRLRRAGDGGPLGPIPNWPGPRKDSEHRRSPKERSMKISRQAYADMFGPTVGDRVRLADTDLWLEVERDFTVYGEEVKFGGGKVIRDGMGQSQLGAAQVVDTVITNALILDHWGVVKADVGLKDGRIQAIGKAGNPDIQPGVNIAIGAGTEVIAGEGMILTAGGIDTHIHFICPQQIEEALMSGVTTMIGGGTGPAAGTNATTCTSGPWHMARMLQAADASR